MQKLCRYHTQTQCGGIGTFFQLTGSYDLSRRIVFYVSLNSESLFLCLRGGVCVM